jgi:hypothetical protein
MSATLIAEAVATQPVEPLLEQLRAQGIRIPRPTEVRDYVACFPDIIPVLRRACELALAEFAGGASLSLELYVDPEIDDRYLTLYLAESSVDAAVWQAIERIEEKYVESLSATSGWLIVIPDFRGGSVAKP